MIYELSDEDILKIVVNGNMIGDGVYGKVYEYDDNTLIKFYYKDILHFFLSKNIDDLNRDIDVNIFVENEMLQLREDYVTKKDRLINIINCLNRVGCSLIKGIVLYRGYPIGVFLNYYKGYVNLDEVLLKLNDKNRLVVMNKVKAFFSRLFDCGIYPLDLKESNILVNVKTLDVQFIDLDGEETRYEVDEYVKQEAIKSFEIMEQRLKVK